MKTLKLSFVCCEKHCCKLFCVSHHSAMHLSCDAVWYCYCDGWWLSLCMFHTLLVCTGTTFCFRFFCALPVWDHWCRLSSKRTFRNMRMLQFPFVRYFWGLTVWVSDSDRQTSWRHGPVFFGLRWPLSCVVVSSQESEKKIPAAVPSDLNLEYTFRLGIIFTTSILRKL